MKLKFLFTLSLFLLSLTAFSQPGRVTIRICPLALTDEISFPTIQGGVELGLSKKLAWYNHAWNAVRIGSQWKLVDVTWGSGYAEMKNDTLIYTPSLNVRYLMVDPRDFLLEHFPEDKKWQLVNKEITCYLLANRIE
jgi:hypothetical protein